jgi:segregation and condensation protein A
MDRNPRKPAGAEIGSAPPREADAAQAVEAPHAVTGPRASAADLAARRPTSVTVKLERFEGPLDLLLHLIKRDEIDIYDIPIARITQQYLSYLELMRSLDLEVAGEFLVMAATLMRIKAKMLLPLPAVGDEEDEGDPREELVQRLVEYRQFKEAANTLKTKEDERRLLHERGMVPGEDDAGPLPLAPATLFDLLAALNRVLARVPEPSVYQVEAETYAVEDKIAMLVETLEQRGRVGFEELLLRCRSRNEMVVTFIALLELVKLGHAQIVQDENFGDIQIVAPQHPAPNPEGADRAPVEP